jgi:hypothetical protein
LIEHLEEDAEVFLHVEGGEGLRRNWLVILIEKLILAIIVKALLGGICRSIQKAVRYCFLTIPNV